MEIYQIIVFIIVIQIIILSIISKKKYIAYKNRKKNLYNIISTIFLSIDISILGYFMYNRGNSVGKDLNTYLYYFKVISQSPIEQLYYATSIRGIEIGYAFFMKLFFMINNSVNMYMIITTIFILVPLYKYIKNESSNYIFSIFLFICFGLYNESFNIIRQFMALSMILLSFKYLKKRNLLKYLVLIFIASLFHSTAIIYILVYPLSSLNLSKNKLAIISILSFFLFFLYGEAISTLLVNIFGYTKYIDRSGLNSVVMYVEILITIVYIFFYNQFKQHDDKANLWIYMSIITVCIAILGNYMDLFHRMTIYFSIHYIISIPSFLSSFNSGKLRSILSVFIIILFVIYYFYGLYNSSLANTVPYIFR